MKFNKGNNKEHHHVFSVSAVNAVAQAQSTVLASTQCAQNGVSWQPLSSFSLWIVLLRYISPPTLFSTDKPV